MALYDVVPVEVRQGAEGLPGAVLGRRDRLLPARPQPRRGDALHGRRQGHPGDREDRAARRHAPRRALQRAGRALARDGRSQQAGEGKPTRARPRPTRSTPRRSTSTRSTTRTIPQLPAMFYRQGKLLLRQRQLRLGREDLGHAAREVPEQRAVARRRRQHPRVVQPREELREHRDLGAPPQGAAQLLAGAKQQEQLDALIVAGRLQAGRAEGGGGRSRRRGRGVPARRQGVPEGRARRAGVRQRRAGGQARRRRQDAAGGRAARDGPAVPRQARVARRRVDRDDDAPGDGALRRRRRHRRADGEPGRSRAPQLLQVRAREGRRVQRGRPARGDRRERPRGARRQQVPRRRTRTAPEADEVVFQMGRAHQNAGRRQGRGGAVQALPRAREEPRPPRAGARAAGAGADQDRRRARGRRLARRGRERSASSAARSCRRRRQVRRRARPLHAGRARRSRSSSRSRSRATSSSSRRASSRRPSC